jgi:hypothetical protein
VRPVELIQGALFAWKPTTKRGPDDGQDRRDEGRPQGDRSIRGHRLPALVCWSCQLGNLGVAETAHYMVVHHADGAGVGGANFKKNLTDLRFEIRALFHVRQATGARRIAAT